MTRMISFKKAKDIPEITKRWKIFITERLLKVKVSECI